MLRLLICGDREWKDEKLIRKILTTVHDKILCVIEGECRGADLLGREAAESLQIPIMAFPANWKYIGRAAGPIRNGSMLNLGKPDRVLAFHDLIDTSRGTKNMLKLAQKANIRYFVVSHAKDTVPSSFWKR
jgi:hypothetical protein